jgi:hypothetical protein
MQNDTEETFKAILKNACLGLEEIYKVDKSLSQADKSQVKTFLDDMKVNYFCEKPETDRQTQLKVDGDPIKTQEAIKMMAEIINYIYGKLSL